MNNLSSLPSRPARPIAARPEVCGQILSDHLRQARLRGGRPVEQVAPLAGLTVPEWRAIEEGEVPDTWEHICLMAAALHIGPTWMPWLMKLYVGARRQ
jgi:hypothetical protein